MEKKVLIGVMVEPKTQKLLFLDCNESLTVNVLHAASLTLPEAVSTVACRDFAGLWPLDYILEHKQAVVPVSACNRDDSSSPTESLIIQVVDEKSDDMVFVSTVERTTTNPYEAKVFTTLELLDFCCLKDNPNYFFWPRDYILGKTVPVAFVNDLNAEFAINPNTACARSINTFPDFSIP
jgi:hypothetical protein